ncbi:UNVERIFIED_CONTAM: hypothetical protein FKN15_040255 [Acipenser sinensis]
MDLKELIERINRNTAAQVEQNKKWRLELGLPEREPTELELLLQKWELESAREAQQSPAPEELGKGREEESIPKPEEVEPWQSPEPPAAIKGEEVLSPDPEEVKSAPPPQLHPATPEARPALVSAVPCPLVLDALSVCLDLPALDLEPRSLHHRPQLCPRFPTPLSPRLAVTPGEAELAATPGDAEQQATPGDAEQQATPVDAAASPDEAEPATSSDGEQATPGDGGSGPSGGDDGSGPSGGDGGSGPSGGDGGSGPSGGDGGRGAPGHEGGSESSTFPPGEGIRTSWWAGVDPLRGRCGREGFLLLSSRWHELLPLLAAKATGAPPLLAAKAAGAPPLLVEMTRSGPLPRTTLQRPPTDPGSTPGHTRGPHKGSPPGRAQTRHT